MIKLNVKNETSRLRAVLLGTAESSGPVPSVNEAYDPKSIQHIKNGSYPNEEDMLKELGALCHIFNKYNVKVYRPEVIKDYNQIFTRDIAFVIDNKII